MPQSDTKEAGLSSRASAKKVLIVAALEHLAHPVSYERNKIKAKIT